MVSRVMILAGGTGGHVYPALAVAHELKARGHTVVWMGTRKGLEARVVPASDIPIEWLTVSGLRGKGWRQLPLAPFMLLKAIHQSGSILGRLRPDVVLGMGGFVSGPGGLVARLMGIPLVLHEQNRIPGTTNRWLARWASCVLEAFPGSFAARVGARVTGNPLRPEISLLASRDPVRPRHACRRILVMGGSLGAQALNEQVPMALAHLEQSPDILHQTGPAMLECTRERYASLGVKAETTDFIQDMAGAYAWADLAICRAGAMTVSELAAAGLPSILIPYPHAIDDHQTANAEFLVEAGAAVLMPQSRLTARSLADLIGNLLSHAARLDEMSECARRLASPAAASTVASLCLQLADSGRGGHRDESA